MKATFLGHGLNAENKFNVGKQIVISLADNKYNSFNGFVAFAAVSGVLTILKNLKLASTNYSQLRFFIGVDNMGTSKEALELLLKENIETYIFHDNREYITYHPKIYIFEGPVFTRIIIGSSNLTNSGIKTNIEASVQIDFRTKTDKQGEKLLSEIKTNFSELLSLKSKQLTRLTTELIEKLVSDNLIYSQKDLGNSIKENKTNDGENPDENEFLTVTEFDINSGFEQNTTESKPRNVNFTDREFEIFEVFIEKYITHIKTINPSGVVSNHTDDRELYNWYRRMTDYFRNDELPEEIFERLLEVDFPFGEGKERKRLMNWNNRFEQLKVFKKMVDPEGKFTHVPQFKDSSNKYYQLGTWCATQKQRRKGNYPPEWTDYEEEKMNSINFLWEASNMGSRPKDDEWIDNLVNLENYYSESVNYKTVPPQTTKVGKWLNDQMTLKLKGSRGKVKKFLSPVREEMLGNLLQRNSVEWEWEKQKHRESVEETLKSWEELKLIDSQPSKKNITETEKELIKSYREKVTQLRHRTKIWDNEKNKWKLDILDNAGFPYPKPNETP
ncbi:phospholipase D-like domain-containing protein [Flavobacterium sp. ZT3R25]|uniref:helicase associated domain-containing protein n=1 Tax=Flavobacterium galactosi TaxID=3398735 RepID=UPI003A886A25